MAKMMSEQPGHGTETHEKHKLQDIKCADKARARNQQTFTLVEQDKTTVKTIAYWILENIESAPESKLYDALESALSMRDFPNKKQAD